MTLLLIPSKNGGITEACGRRRACDFQQPVKDSSMLLTFAIPIFNGERCLESTLTSLIPELVQGCEIVISDNYSSDTTGKIANEYLNRYPEWVRYFKNTDNFGFDNNLDLLVERSRGRYVWFFGCGERLKQGILKGLIERLLRDEPDVSVVNFDIYSEVARAVVSHQAVPGCVNIATMDRDDFSIPRYSPAVSANIVNKELWDSVSARPLLVNGWCHVERILDMIGSNRFRRSLYISDPLFTLFRDKDGWWTKPNSYLLLLLLLHIKIIRSMPSRGFLKSTAAHLENKHSRWALLMAVLQSKSYGLTLNVGLIRSLIRMFWNRPFFWFLVAPSLLLPSWLLVKVRKLREARMVAA